MTRSRTRRWPLALVAPVVLVCGAACGSKAAGPLQTADPQGQPYVSIAWSLVRPGKSLDGEAYVINSAADPVQITGMTAVPVTDEPQGHVMFVTPTVGAEIPHGLNGIFFALAGPATDHYYAVAGLRIEYEYHGHAYSTVAWDGAAACVYTDKYRHTDWASCTTFGDKVTAIVEDMSGLY